MVKHALGEANASLWQTTAPQSASTQVVATQQGSSAQQGDATSDRSALNDQHRAELARTTTLLSNSSAECTASLASPKPSGSGSQGLSSASNTIPPHARLAQHGNFLARKQPLCTSPSNAQSPRSRPQGASKYFTWSLEDTLRLVNVIYKNEQYQRALLPRHSASVQEKGLKITKEVLLGRIYDQVFPHEKNPNGFSRIKCKIRWLISHYNDRIEKFQQTSAGLLLCEMDRDHPDYKARVATARAYPWFERWHEMVSRRPATGPLLDTRPSSETAPMQSTSQSVVGHMDKSKDERQPQGCSLPLQSDSSRSIQACSSAVIPASRSTATSAAGPTNATRTLTCLPPTSTVFGSDSDRDSDSDSASCISAFQPRKKARSSSSNDSRDDPSEMLRVKSLALLAKIEQERTKREQMWLKFERERQEMRLKFEREREEMQLKFERERQEMRLKFEREVTTRWERILADQRHFYTQVLQIACRTTNNREQKDIPPKLRLANMPAHPAEQANQPDA